MMTRSESSEPGSRRSHLAIGVSVLLLALAVFGWGLRSKLSLYHVARTSEATPIAKLLSERERPADAAQHCSADRNDLDAVAVSAAVVLLAVPDDILRTPKPRADVPPLPSRTFTFKGPSLRRPPPSLVA
jgi:hypothetical protein